MISIYSAPAFFISAMAVFAIYSYLSIRGNTASVLWHITQWISVLEILAAGFLFGLWWKGFNFHELGRIIAIGVIGITVYVFLLHWLLRR